VDREAAPEHRDPRLGQNGDHLVAAVQVVVVVAQDGDDRDRKVAAGVREHCGLLGVAVRRQVAGEQDQLCALGDRGERLSDVLAERLRAVDVACGGNANRPAHALRLPPVRRFANGGTGTGVVVPFTPPDNFPDLIEAMKVAAAALRDAEVPYLLGGGLAAWARGGPPTEHDVDLFVKEEDAERALDALVEAGMRPERPPEGWLLKAWHGDTMIDLIFNPAGGPVGEEHFDRAEFIEVMAQPMLVASLDDVVATKLLAINEQSPDFSSVLELARSLREQIDWELVRERTADSPFARAFFTLIEELGIVAPAASA
jgi:hypothetical protein